MFCVRGNNGANFHVVLAYLLHTVSTLIVSRDHVWHGNFCAVTMGNK